MYNTRVLHTRLYPKNQLCQTMSLRAQETEIRRSSVCVAIISVPNVFPQDENGKMKYANRDYLETWKVCDAS